MSSTPSAPLAQERSLTDWLRLLRDGWPLFVICVVLGLAGALFYTSRQKAQYGATYTLVASGARGFLDPQNADQLPALADTVARLANTTPVLRNTARRYAGSAVTPHQAAQRRRLATPNWVASHVSTVREASSAILRVSGSAGTQRDASDLAQAAGRSIAYVVNQTSGVQHNVPGGLQVTGFPVKVDGKTSPTPSRNILIGVNAGVLLGLLAAFLLGVLRHRLWCSREIAAEFQVPVLGTVRRVRGKRILMGPGFAAFQPHLAAHRRDDRALTILVSGLTSDGGIMAVSQSMVRALEAYGSRTLLLNRDLQNVREGMPGDSTHISVSRKGGGVTADNETIENPTEPDRAAAPQSAPFESSPFASRTSLAQTTVEVADPAPAADFVIIVGPPVDSKEVEMAELAKQADHAILVIERGTSRRALRRVHDAGLTLECRLLGTIVVE